MINFLSFYANPRGTDNLELDKEIRQIQDDLAWTKEKNLQFIDKKLVRKQEIIKWLEHYKPAIVQFSCHATENGELVLEDEKGKPSLVPEDALEVVFKNFKSTVNLVILNCCYTEEQARAISRHIPCVVGMRTQVYDVPARLFTSGFLQYITLGYSLQGAFDMALAQLNLLDSELADVPQLIARNGANPSRLFLLPKPAIQAWFDTEDLNELSVKDDYYRICIAVKHAPPGISSVVYQLCDEERDFKKQFYQSDNKTEDFYIEIAEWGNIPIRASLWGVDAVALNTMLSDALTHYYKSNGGLNKVRPLIKSIREN